jgi:hypothetical protein
MQLGKLLADFASGGNQVVLEGKQNQVGIVFQVE